MKARIWRLAGEYILPLLVAACAQAGWRAHKFAVAAYDGRETASAPADERLFLGADGKPLPSYAGVVGGRSVGVPGVLAMLEMAHREHGRLPWKTLFEPAIRLAEEGFPVSPLLHAELAEDKFLKNDPVAAAYFYDDKGAPHAVGHRLKNPELARVFAAIATHGSRVFYTGDIAARVQAPPNPGRLTERDQAAYTAKRREAFCTDWKSYRLCGFPPHSSGAIAITQILGILEQDEAAHPGRPALDHDLPAADWLHTYSEAARLAYADRNRYVADPDFVPAPGGDWKSLARISVACRVRIGPAAG